MYYIVGQEDFFFGGGYKNFQDEDGGIGNFQLIFRGISNLPVIVINSVALHCKLIYHLPEIFNTMNANRI